MTRLARTEYYYDEFKGAGANGLQACPNIVYAGHDLASDPYVPGAYNPVTEYRGNVTTIKRFADPIGLNPATAEVETRRYDVAGNLVKTNSSCCEQTTITLNESTQYTWPTSVTRGSVSNASHQNTTEATYDFNTGLVKTSTDANGRISQILYETANLRPTWEYAPTGAYNYYIYDDAGLIVYDLTYEVGKSGGDFASRSDKYLDGFGRVHGEVAYGAGYALDIVNTKYDEFGRIMEQTRPYRFGDAQKWYTQEFDPLGRVKKVTIPDTSGIVEYFYNDATYPDAASSSSAPGQTVRLKDQWGRERWGRFDALGRLAEVVEPNPDPVQNPNQTVATGGWLTEYKYNARDELEEAWQWEPGKQWKQLRKFRYDGLGRLTHQKLAERDATLNDSGAAGSTWSDYFSYDPRSRLVLRVDARRVRTNFSYYNPQLGADDPLNRLQSVSYDKSQAIDAANIIDAPSVTYNYMTTNDKERLQSVTLSNGVGNLTFGYDSEGRLNQRTQTFAGISGGYSLVTGYTYDSLSRIWRITYPQQFFGSWANRQVEHTYDIASRLNSLKYDSSTLATITDYNADSQTLGMSVGSLTESYTYDPGTGLLINQQVKQGGTELLDLDYYYTTGTTLNNTGAKTGQLTKLVDKKNQNRNRAFTYDALTRLTAVSGGSNAPTGSPQWRQKYAYDRFGNRSGVAWDTSGGLIIPSNVPLDGLATLAFTDAQGKVLMNRITTSGYTYDSAGNQTSGQAPDGSSQSYKYDAAGRLAEVKITGGAVLATYSYGAGNERLIASENGGAVITYYAWSGGQVIAEYQQSGSALSFQKGYVYMGGRLLLTENTSGDRQYHHANRLGTQLVTNASTGAVVSEQIGLPYGTMLPSGSIQYGDGSYQLQNNHTKQRFTSYDRSGTTGLDYAVNRTYNSGQGRFTQVDPIGMNAVQLDAPQTLNLYSYCANDPVNHLDQDGLFFGFLIGVLAAVFGAIGSAIAVVAKVIVEVVLTVVVTAINAVGTLLVNLFDKVPWLKSVLISGFTEGEGVFSWKRLIISSAIAGAGAIALHAQKRGGQDRRLQGDGLKRYLRAAGNALKLLRNKNSDCAKFLRSRGIDPDKVADSLEKQKAYDGLRSTTAAPGLLADQSVAEVFKTTDRDAMGKEGSATEIYYHPNRISTTLVIHETIHKSAKLGDRALAGTLGISDADFDAAIKTPGKGTRVIDDKLREKGCK